MSLGLLIRSEGCMVCNPNKGDKQIKLLLESQPWNDKPGSWNKVIYAAVRTYSSLLTKS